MNTPPKKPGGPGASSLGQQYGQRMAPGGASSQSIPGAVPAVQLVRNVPSAVQVNPALTLMKNVGATPLITLVNEWTSGDPSQARPVRLTMAGTIPNIPVSGGSSDGQYVWGMQALVEWGSQSGAVQKIWMPVPCDYDLCATYIRVHAAITPIPYGCPPRAFITQDVPNTGQGQIICSFSEGSAEGATTWPVGYANSITLGYVSAAPQGTLKPPVPQNVIVTDVLWSSDPTIATTQSWVCLIDRPIGYVPTFDTDLLTSDHRVKLPISPGQSIAEVFDNQAFFQGVMACCVTSPGVGGALDTTNGPGIQVEVRGYMPGLFGLVQPNPTT